MTALTNDTSAGSAEGVAASETGNAGRGRILNRPLVLVFAANAGSMTSFYLLLAVVPMYAASVGAGAIGAGLSTGAFMAATVAAELVTPWLAGRIGATRTMAAGLVLLSLPALALPLAPGLASIVAVSAVRGIGLGFAVVMGGALVARLVPAERRAEALGLSGVVVGVPSVIALPLGVWLAGQVGYGFVLAAAAVIGIVAACALLGVPAAETADHQRPLGVLAGLRTGELVRPAAVFCATAVAAGAIVTFLPAAVPAHAGAVAGAALFGYTTLATLSRWWAGRYGDRRGPATLLVPGVVLTAVGMLGLALVDNLIVVVTAATICGAGFGITQNASLSVMYASVSPAGFSAVSAVWNLAYDAGLGLGGAGFGVLVAYSGYPTAFAATALALPAVLLLLVRRRRAAPAT